MKWIQFSRIVGTDDELVNQDAEIYLPA